MPKLDEFLHIDPTKLLNYLLKKLEKNDKSAFLAKLGFDQSNSEELDKALRELVQENEAEISTENEYGIFYIVKGLLKGSLNSLLVTTVWLKDTLTNVYRFITLYPTKK